MNDFVESNVSNEFGLTVEEVAQGCKSYSRFSSWLNGDVSNIKRVLNIVKDNGISPAFFASYEASEGYNESWGWLNHTIQKGTYYEDAKSVANVVKSASNNMTSNPTWIDAGNPLDFVPESVKSSGNAHFQGLPKGTIGRAIIPLTAAATWGTYFPNGLKKEYNGVQNYADPIKTMKDLIIQWGGSINGGVVPDPDPDPDPDPEPEPEPDDPVVDVEGFIEAFKNLFKFKMYDVSDNFKTNNFFKLTQTYDNMYQLKFSPNFMKIIEDLLTGIAPELPDPDPSPDPDPDPDPDPSPDPDPTNEWFFPVNKNASGLNFWFPPHDSNIKKNMDYGTRTTGVFHAGYDIGGGGNSNIGIHAVTAGTVELVKLSTTDRGFYIIINHSSDNKKTLYQHLKNGSNIVKQGDAVTAGQRIATMGATGANGVIKYDIHLHIELTETGSFTPAQANTIDPKKYLKVTADNVSGLSSP